MEYGQAVGGYSSCHEGKNREEKMRKTSTTVRLKLGAAVVFISVAASGFGTNPRLGSPAKDEKNAMNLISVETQTVDQESFDPNKLNSNKEVAAEINRLVKNFKDDNPNGCKGSFIQRLLDVPSGENDDLVKKIKDGNFVVVNKSRTDVAKEAFLRITSEAELFPGGPKVVVYAKK